MSGTVSVVTGASRGLGSHIAAHLAHLGSTVVLVARDADRLQRRAQQLAVESGGVAIARAFDIRDAGEWSALATELDERREELGATTVLVNNAAVLGPVGRIDAIDPAAWRDAVEVDLVAPAVAIAALVPGLAASQAGRIVNLSGGGIGGPRPITHASAYAAAKAGVMALTEVLAAELAPLGITVNAIAPGTAATGFMASAVTAGVEVAGPELHRAAMAQADAPTLPSGLLELIDLIVRPDAGWVTGRCLSARWDRPETLAADSHRLASSDRFRLRRIDDDLYCERLEHT